MHNQQHEKSCEIQNGGLTTVKNFYDKSGEFSADSKEMKQCADLPELLLENFATNLLLQPFLGCYFGMHKRR